MILKISGTIELPKHQIYKVFYTEVTLKQNTVNPINLQTTGILQLGQMNLLQCANWLIMKKPPSSWSSSLISIPRLVPQCQMSSLLTSSNNSPSRLKDMQHMSTSGMEWHTPASLQMLPCGSTCELLNHISKPYLNWTRNYTTYHFKNIFFISFYIQYKHNF